MIRQPDFFDAAFFDTVINVVRTKKPYPLLDKVKFETITDGRCIQMLHVGPVDDQPATLDKMGAYEKEMNVERKSKNSPRNLTLRLSKNRA